MDPRRPFTHRASVKAAWFCLPPDMAHNAFLQIALTVPKVSCTENQVTYNKPFLFNPRGITKMQS